MHPAPSIIFFTVGSGAGYGLLFLLGLAGPLGLIPPERWFGFAGMALALGAVTLGLLASTFHLGHPERAWRAVTQWRTSWLSREGVMALITYVPALAFGFGWVVLERTGGWFALTGVLSAAGAALTVWCTAMIYASLKPVRAWRHPLVPPIYLVLALMTGALVCHALLAAFGLPHAFAGWIALLAAIAGLGLKAAYWREIADDRGASTSGSATGLGELGLVRLLDPPHTESNYLLDEMGYRVARKHAGRLRLLCYGLAFVAPALLTVLALLVPGLAAAALAWLAALLGIAGVVIERWLFFAEAKHTVTLYYGSPAA